MKNLIPNDYSRCNNHQCQKRSNCKRYLQLGVDFKDANEHVGSVLASKKVFSTVPVTRFDENNCQNQIV
ncbi:MAG TPA: hypothetical protein VFF15_08215 [Flavobacteriaceae bacterium]|nr:hypothetical protein [Flavobacteriaceae bacterium]